MAELTKREQREIARRERREREAVLSRRTSQRKIATKIVVGLVVLALVGAAVYFLLLSNNPVVPTGPTVGQSVPDEGRTHVPEGSNISYATYPPASGNHYPIWLPYGFHDQPSVPGYWVHNLEHGSIVILYNCGSSDCAQLKDQLRQVYATFPPGKYGAVKMVILPDDQIATPLVALAWDWKLELQSFDREQLLAFYNAHVDRGPEDIP